MKIKFQNLVIEFPLELQAVLDLGLKCGYSEHPSFWFEAVVPEEKAKSYIGKITEDTKVKVTYENKKKKAQRVLFSGYTSDAKLQYTNGYYILRVKALCHTAKLDIEKKSRSFFKKNITYKEIVEAIAKDYPGAVVKQNIKSDRKTDMPILQYEETDWQFLKRIASMFEAVVTPDCTKDIAFLTLGIPERETKAKNIAKEEQTSIRDLKGCYEDFYEEMSAFSVLKLMKQEKEQKKKEAEKKKVKKELHEKLGSTGTVAQMGMGSAADFLDLEQKQEKEDIQKQTLQNIETMIDAGLLDVSKLHYDKKDLKNLIMDAMDTLEEEEAKASGKAKKQLNVDTEKGKQAAESNMQELNHTTIVVRSTKYVPLGKRILIDDSELAVTHVEAFVENEIVYYEHILRWPDAITARYHDNPLLAGVCLIGTVKQRIGNTISIKLEIDQDDGYDNGGEDYFFTYAIESKDYYCMPVEGAKVHLYFQTGKEWDAIAVHSLRGLEAGGQREHKISNPDNRSLSNPDGCSIDLTPGGISMTPDDGSKVELKLGKDGTMSMRADNFTITGKNIELGKATTADGEEVICESLCVSAGEHLFINRCQGSEGGEVVPIEDHLAAVFGTTQIYATGLVYHLTDGEFRAPSISYDETELRKKERKETNKNNRKIKKALIQRREEAKRKFGMGVVMGVVGAALIVTTGGAAAFVVGAGMVAVGTAEAQEGMSLKNLAENGDWASEPDNFLKKAIGEPAYTLLKDGLCIAASVMIGGPAVLIGPGINSAVTFAFDAADGHIDTPWQNYLDSFAQGCLVSAITGPIGNKLGNCNSAALRFAGNFGQQMASSTLSGIMNGELSLESLGENAVRELIGTVLGNSVPSSNKWKSAALNASGDTAVEAAFQLYKDGKIDAQALAQTAITSGMNNLLFSCDPVSCSRGNFFVYRKDYSREDLFGEWTFARRYSSILEYTGSMGRGWLHEYEIFLLHEEDGGILAILPDTHIERFAMREGKWENRRGGTKEYQLDETENGYLLTSWQEGVYKAYRFDKTGRLTAVAYDPFSRKETRITYVGQGGQIHTVTSPGGHTLQFQYDKDRLVQVVDETGRTLSYEYEGDLLATASYPTGGKQTYLYDGSGRIETMDGWDGRDFLSNQYDKQGRVICQTYPDGNTCTIDYDDRHQETWFTFSDTGRWEHYYCDHQDHVLRTERGCGAEARKQIEALQEQTGYRSEETFAAIGELSGISVESYVFDEQGNKIAETDKNGNLHTWQYDPYGLVTREEYANGFVVEHDYDAWHRVCRTTDNNGGKTEYRYDPKTGKKQTEIKWISDTETVVTQYDYDRYGRITEVTDSCGNVESYSYDEEGNSHNPLFYTAADGTEFAYTLDSMGRTASITSPYGTVHLTHSDTGEIVRTEDALGNVTEKMVDAIGNVLKLVTPNAHEGSMEGENAFRYRYDYLDRRIESRDPYGTVHRTFVDMDGNVIKEVHPEAYDRNGDDGAGYRYTYDADQYRVKRTDPEGNITRYKYDRNGNIIKIILPEAYQEDIDDGAGMEYTYDSANRLTAVLSPEGEVIRSFVYDLGGRLIEEADANGIATCYEYNRAGWLVRKWEPVEESKEGILYNLTCYAYDKAGNKIQEKRSGKAVEKGSYPAQWLTLNFTYDKRNRLIKVEDSLGAAMEYTYDCLNNKASEKARINENTYQYTRYEYDAAGRLVKTIQSVDREDVGLEPNRYVKKEFLTTTYAYDKNGNVTKIVTPEGYEITREYDLLDRKTKETHVDKTSGIERTTEYRYDKAGNLVEETDSRGSIRRCYDLQDQMTEEVDREGNTRRFQYDKNGNLIKIAQLGDCPKNGEEGESYTFTYDSMGRLESVRNALGFLEEQNEYDANGNLIRRKDALGTLVEFTYDVANRQKNVWTGEALRAKNQTESLESDQRSASAGKPSQTYTYDARGNITGITDGEGNQTRYDLDAWGRITTIHKPDGSEETYTYDYAGNITAATDGNGNTIQYHFNSMNKLEEIVDQNGEKETFTYDSQGRMASHTDRNHVKTTYGYNMDDQLRFKRAEQLDTTETQAIQSRKTASVTLENKYSYNSLGQLSEASGGGVVYNYTYTPNGNVKDKLVNGDKALSYTYTASGKVAGITDKSGKKTAYQYDKAGRVLSVSDNGNPVAEYSYYEDGNLRQVKFANGVETNYAYNADKNYKNIVTKTAEGEILLDYSYAYDGNGNRTRKTGADHVTKHCGNDSSVGITTYAYDSLQRLQEVSYPTGKVEQFQYDNAGNRALKKYGTAENFKTGNYLEERYQYDNRNRLLERKNPQDVTYYQYDKQGNTVSELTKRFLKPETVKTQNGSITTVSSSLEKMELEQYKTYEYDSFNKVEKAIVENYTNGTKEVHTQQNFYDAENLRYGIEEDNVRTNFVTNGWSVFTELDAEWKPTKRLVRGYGIVASEEVETTTITDRDGGYSNGYHYYHQNEHGDIEYITEKDGKIENAYTYDAFGNITNSTELVKNRYNYNGEQYDQVTQ